MTAITDRRTLLSVLATAPLLALPGCASVPGFSLTDAVRELLTLSSQRAFAMLLQPGGFYDSEVARIDLPPQLGGPGATSVISRLLMSNLFKDRLIRQVNSAAEKGAERAAPLVADAIRSISIADAAAIIRGGPTAATDLLERAMGDSLVGAMFPGIEQGLRLADHAIVTEALRIATGINFQGLARDISNRARDAVYHAIGAEEAAIRANPRATGNPLLIGAFALGR
ncbi:MAG: DUF4197 domain-containing protein [Sphingopyxis sp.]|uniref:DUF4197 domain-containing protein n=1 Tax=Sphingopyxis sp. TaxID=1908224 RepID=UPI002ABCE5C3|nr:DUF4197 domain-containing protein [Sphingopyxis sp.]MDZ3833558.1 DUF4197 domain-containing protein [Sphingopyxis sp.]